MSFDQTEDAIVGSLKQSLVCCFWSCYCYICFDFKGIKSKTILESTVYHTCCLLFGVLIYPHIRSGEG